MDMKKPKVIRAPGPDADLYDTPKKERKVTDKDLFVLPLKKQQKKKKSK
tara:strand:+ start:605 stop:751 length:147 start_codon:yes stop_codon:yes gene_type:complete